MSEFDVCNQDSIERAKEYLRLLDSQKMLTSLQRDVFLNGSVVEMVGLANWLYGTSSIAVNAACDKGVFTTETAGAYLQGVAKSGRLTDDEISEIKRACIGDLENLANRVYGRLNEKPRVTYGPTAGDIAEREAFRKSFVNEPLSDFKLGFDPGDGKDRSVSQSVPVTQTWADSLNSAPSTANYPLFEHMQKEHGLTLTESELSEIVGVVKGMEPKVPVPDFVTREEMLKTIRNEIADFGDGLRDAFRKLSR